MVELLVLALFEVSRCCACWTGDEGCWCNGSKSSFIVEEIATGGVALLLLVLVLLLVDVVEVMVTLLLLRVIVLLVRYM